jgi:ABC-type antimicrobial peptide transport system permease subunit
MKSFLYKSKLLISIFCVSAFLITLASASIVKFSSKGLKEIPGISDNYIISEINLLEDKDDNYLKIQDLIDDIIFNQKTYMLVKRYKLGRGILYSKNYKFDLNIIKGRLFNQNDFSTKNNVAIISNDYLSECVEKQNKLYVTHLGLPYEVIGVFEGIVGSSVDEIMYYVNLNSDNLKDESIFGVYYFDFKSNTTRIFNNIKEFIMNHNEHTIINHQRGVNKDSSKITRVISNSKLMIIIILIGGILVIVNAFSSTTVWIGARKKEIGLRRMFGGKKYQIYLWIIKEYLKIIFLSFAMGILPAILLILNSKSIESVPSIYHLFGDIFNVLYIIVALIILLVLGILILILALKHFNNIMISKNLR